MPNHFRSAVLAVILAGGTLTSYAAAYAVLGCGDAPAPVVRATVKSSDRIAKRLAPFQTDMSVREACSTFEGAGARESCLQTIGGQPRPVRVIDFASSLAPTRS